MEGQTCKLLKKLNEASITRNDQKKLLLQSSTRTLFTMLCTNTAALSGTTVPIRQLHNARFSLVFSSEDLTLIGQLFVSYNEQLEQLYSRDTSFRNKERIFCSPTKNNYPSVYPGVRPVRQC